jgi:GntR family transcriptional regulator
MAKQRLMGIEEGSQLYRLKVLRSVTGLPLALCYSEIPQKLVPNLEEYLNDYFSINHILLNNYGYKHPICKSLTIEAVMPTAEEIKLLQISADIPLLREVCIFEVPGVGPVEYFVVRARGDRYKLSMNF